MKTIKELFGVSGNSCRAHTTADFGHSCYMGLELEVEDYTSSDEPPKGWNRIGDGSLRNNGVEFVMRSPKANQYLLSCIEDISQHLNQNSFSTSHRCSVHCHIDFRDATTEQVRKFFKLYMLLEPALYTMSSKDRYMNIYCPGLTHTSYQVELAGKYMRSEAGLLHLARSWSKYTGINLAALSSFGSIEIRTHSGTGSAEDLRDWVRVLNYLKTSAMFMNEEDIDSITTPEEVAELVFPQELRHAILVPNLRTFFNSALTNLSYFNLVGQVVDAWGSRPDKDTRDLSELTTLITEHLGA